MENIHNIDNKKIVWGAKLMGNNYKSVTMHGELYALGDCVQCHLEFKNGHVGKIIKLFQKDDKKMCKIRNFFSSSEFSPLVKGLNYNPKPKELFLASGEGLGVENEILLDNIIGRCIVLCTANEHFNEMPSHKQIEDADNFFSRGYDPINNEIVGLDTVEEAIGAQKIYNKKDWLLDKTIGQLPLQKKTMKYILKKKFKTEVKEIPIERFDAHYERIVFAILAPSKTNLNKSLEILPIKNTSHLSSMSKTKVIQCKEEGRSIKESSSSIFQDYPKLDATKDEGTNIETIEKKIEDIISEKTPNKFVKPIQKKSTLVEKERPLKLQKKTNEGGIIATSYSSKTLAKTILSEPILHTRKVVPARNFLNDMNMNLSVMKMGSYIPYTNLCTSKEIPQRQVFKPKIEDWNASLVPAIQSNRILLLKNLNLGFHSDELAETFSNIMKIKCEVRILPFVSSNYKNTMALLKLPSAKKAQDAIYEIESSYLLLENRLVTATLFNYQEFKASQLLKYHGHLEFPKEGRDYVNDDNKNVMATSHLAQGNTIEFAFGLPWRVLDEQHEAQWQMLQEGMLNSLFN